MDSSKDHCFFINFSMVLSFKMDFSSSSLVLSDDFFKIIYSAMSKHCFNDVPIFKTKDGASNLSVVVL